MAKIFFIMLFMVIHPAVFSEVLPPVGQRLYFLNEKGEIEIVASQKKEVSLSTLKKFKDPIFDIRKHLEIQALEKKALIERSNLVDRSSLIELSAEYIKGRAARPRIKFEQNFLPVDRAEEDLKFQPLNKMIEEEANMPDW